MTLIVLSLLVAICLSATLYVFLDAFGGSGNTDSKVQRRLEGLLTRRARSIVNQTQYSGISKLHDVLKRTSLSKRIQQMLILTGWSMPLGAFILADLLFGAITVAFVHVFLKNYLLAAAAGAGAAAVPYFFLVIVKRRYVEKFTTSFPDALIIMKSALKAGLGLQEAFHAVAQEGPKPVSTEFGRVVQEIELGSQLGEALNELYQRIRTLDIRLFVLGMHIQYEVGGNLIELFDHVENTIRERVSLGRELKVLSAQGKMTGGVLILLPIGLVFLIGALNPTFFLPLTQDDLGKMLIWAAVIMQVVGGIVIHNMTNCKPTI